MIPGLGLIRRAITLGLCSASFWAGMQYERLIGPPTCTGTSCVEASR